MANQPYPAQGPYGPPTNDIPPAYQYQPPPPGAAVTKPPPNVTVVKTAPPPQKKTGMFGSFMKEVDRVGKQLGKELDSAGTKINEAVDKNYSSCLLDLFGNGNVVQLISRVSGRTMQIVSSHSGQLLLDANGPLDPNAFNSLWTVVNEGQNQIRLQNYTNFIAIIQGNTVLVNLPPGVTPGLESKFQLSQIQQFITLESLKEKTRHVGFTRTGELKSALATNKEMDAQFGVKLVSTAYPAIQPVRVVQQK